jgi:phospholipid/cholesterol/gamma-HCH transport system substrate-binding protein
MKTVRLGIFIVGTLAVLAAGIFLIGSRKLSFSSTYSLRAEFQNAGGLVAGADVRVGGIHMGTVRAIELPQTPDGKVSVRMDLENKTRGVVKRDSTASIQTEGLLGDEYVAVSFGTKDGQPIRSGDTIGSEPVLEMSGLLKKTDAILDQVQDVSKNMAAISGKINDGAGSVGALINDKSLYNKVNSGAAAFQEDAEALKHNFLLRGFFKNRGYEDASELTRNAIQQLPSGPTAKEFTLDAKGLFDKPDTAKLKNEKELNPAGQFLQSNPFGLAVVAALGSAKGDSTQEKQLTLARAAVVRDYLVKNFRLDDTRIKTIGLAKQTDSPAGAVEIMVYSTAAPRETTGGH